MKAGEIYENRVTGEYVTVIEGSEDTEAEYALAELRVAPGGAVAQAHVHDLLDEDFEVLGGEVGLMLGEREATLVRGEKASVPAGTVHDWWNAGSSEAVVKVRVSRGLGGDADAVRGFEEMLTTIFALARAGKTNDKGMPGLLQLAVIAQEHERIIRFTKPPRAVQKLLFGVLAPIGRACGLRGTVDYGEPGPAR